MKKPTAFFVLFFYLFSEVSAACALELPAEALSQKVVPSINIPAHLGTLEEAYFPGNQNNAPLVIHIQTAHGSPEASLKIRDIIRHVTKEYGAGLILAEGASEPLEPKLLRFSADKAKNEKIIETLTSEGELTGVDLSLLEEGTEAVGIEGASLYRDSYEAYKKVISRREDSAAYIESLKLSLDKEASKVFSPPLRALVQEWFQFENGSRDLTATLSFLRRRAKTTLRTDFENPYSQFEWPQLTRLVIVQELEKRLDANTLAEERKKLSAWIEGKKIQSTLDALLDAPEKTSSPRLCIEKFLEDAYPLGFMPEKYPAVLRRASYEVLKSEIDIQPLISEFNALFERLFENEAGEDEKELISKYDGIILLDKLLRLELTPFDRDKLAPSLPQNADGFESSLKETALGFYHLMELREEAFAENVAAAMKKSQRRIAVLVTGGYHAEGMKRLFKDNGIGFASVRPLVTGEIDGKIYRKVMTGSSQLEQTLLTHPPAVSYAAHGWDIAAQRTRVLSAHQNAGVDAETEAPYFTAVEAALSGRSELRKRDGGNAEEIIMSMAREIAARLHPDEKRVTRVLDAWSLLRDKAGATRRGQSTAVVGKSSLTRFEDPVKKYFLAQGLAESFTIPFKPDEISSGLVKASERTPEFVTDFLDASERRNHSASVKFGDFKLRFPFEYSRNSNVQFVRYGRPSQLGLLRDTEHPQNAISFQIINGELWMGHVSGGTLKKADTTKLNKASEVSLAGTKELILFDSALTKQLETETLNRQHSFGFSGFVIYLSADKDQRYSIERHDGKSYRSGTAKALTVYTTEQDHRVDVLRLVSGDNETFYIEGLGWRDSPGGNVLPLLIEKSGGDEKNALNLNRILDMVRTGELAAHASAAGRELVVDEEAIRLGLIPPPQYIAKEAGGRRVKVSDYRIRAADDVANSLSLIQAGTITGKPETDQARSELRASEGMIGVFEGALWHTLQDQNFILTHEQSFGESLIDTAGREVGWAKGFGQLDKRSGPGLIYERIGGMIYFDHRFKKVLTPMASYYPDIFKNQVVYLHHMNSPLYTSKHELDKFAASVVAALDTIDVKEKSILLLGSVNSLLALSALRRGASKVILAAGDAGAEALFLKHAAENGFSPSRFEFISGDIRDHEAFVPRLTGKNIQVVFSTIGEHKILAEGTHLSAIALLARLPSVEVYVAGGYFLEKEDTVGGHLTKAVEALAAKGFNESRRYFNRGRIAVVAESVSRGDAKEVEARSEMRKTAAWTEFVPKGLKRHPSWEKSADYKRFFDNERLRYHGDAETALSSIEQHLASRGYWLRGMIGKEKGVVLGFGMSPEEMLILKKHYRLRQVHGVEWIDMDVMSAAQYLAAKNQKPGEFVLHHSDLNNLNGVIPALSMNFVLANGTSYYPPDAAFAEKINRMLAPGGVAIVNGGNSREFYHYLSAYGEHYMDRSSLSVVFRKYTFGAASSLPATAGFIKGFGRVRSELRTSTVSETPELFIPIRTMIQLGVRRESTKEGPAPQFLYQTINVKDYSLIAGIPPGQALAYVPASPFTIDKKMPSAEKLAPGSRVLVYERIHHEYAVRRVLDEKGADVTLPDFWQEVRASSVKTTAASGEYRYYAPSISDWSSIVQADGLAASLRGSAFGVNFEEISGKQYDHPSAERKETNTKAGLIYRVPVPEADSPANEISFYGRAEVWLDTENKWLNYEEYSSYRKKRGAIPADLNLRHYLTKRAIATNAVRSETKKYPGTLFSVVGATDITGIAVLPGGGFGDATEWWMNATFKRDETGKIVDFDVRKYLEPARLRMAPSHEGVDILIGRNEYGDLMYIPPGTGVRPAAAGKVDAVIPDVMGDTVIVEHPQFSNDYNDRAYTLYSHVKAQVKAGDAVTGDTVLAEIADPGKEWTGAPPHLHFSLMWIPQDFQEKAGRPVDWAEYHKAFMPYNPYFAPFYLADVGAVPAENIPIPRGMKLIETEETPDQKTVSLLIPILRELYFRMAADFTAVPKLLPSGLWALAHQPSVTDAALLESVLDILQLLGSEAAAADPIVQAFHDMFTTRDYKPLLRAKLESAAQSFGEKKTIISDEDVFSALHKIYNGSNDWYVKGIALQAAAELSTVPDTAYLWYAFAIGFHRTNGANSLSSSVVKNYFPLAAAVDAIGSAGTKAAGSKNFLESLLGSGDEAFVYSSYSYILKEKVRRALARIEGRGADAPLEAATRRQITSLIAPLRILSSLYAYRDGTDPFLFSAASQYAEAALRRILELGPQAFDTGPALMELYLAAYEVNDLEMAEFAAYVMKVTGYYLDEIPQKMIARFPLPEIEGWVQIFQTLTPDDEGEYLVTIRVDSWKVQGNKQSAGVEDNLRVPAEGWNGEEFAARVRVFLEANLNLNQSGFIDSETFFNGPILDLPLLAGLPPTTQEQLSRKIHVKDGVEREEQRSELRQKDSEKKDLTPAFLLFTRDSFKDNYGAVASWYGLQMLLERLKGIKGSYAEVSVFGRGVKVSGRAHGEIVREILDRLKKHRDKLNLKKPYFIYRWEVKTEKGKAAPRWVLRIEQAPGLEEIYPRGFDDSEPVEPLIAEAVEKTNDGNAEPPAPPQAPGIFQKQNLDVYRMVDDKTGASVEIVPEAGGKAVSFKVRGQEILYHPEDLTWDGGIPVMFPWPNRLENMKFSFAGNEIDLKVSRLVRDLNGSGLHGMAMSARWKVLRQWKNKNGSFTELTLEDEDAREISKYFGKFEVRMTYRLKAEELNVSIDIRNADTKDIVTGIGFHPWINTPGDNWHVRLPGAQRWPVRADLIPSGAPVPVDGKFDLRKGVMLGASRFDDVFTDLFKGRQTEAESVLYDPSRADGMEIFVRQGKKFPHAVLWTPGGGHVSIEPMSMATDGFNLAARGIKQATPSVIAAGQTFKAGMTLGARFASRSELRTGSETLDRDELIFLDPLKTARRIALVDNQGLGRRFAPGAEIASYRNYREAIAEFQGPGPVLNEKYDLVIISDNAYKLGDNNINGNFLAATLRKSGYKGPVIIVITESSNDTHERFYTEVESRFTYPGLTNKGLRTFGKNTAVLFRFRSLHNPASEDVLERLFAGLIKGQKVSIPSVMKEIGADPRKPRAVSAEEKVPFNFDRLTGVSDPGPELPELMSLIANGRKLHILDMVSEGQFLQKVITPDILPMVEGAYSLDLMTLRKLVTTSGPVDETAKFPLQIVSDDGAPEAAARLAAGEKFNFVFMNAPYLQREAILDIVDETGYMTADYAAVLVRLNSDDNNAGDLKWLDYTFSRWGFVRVRSLGEGLKNYPPTRYIQNSSHDKQLYIYVKHPDPSRVEAMLRPYHDKENEAYKKRWNQNETDLSEAEKQYYSALIKTLESNAVLVRRMIFDPLKNEEDVRALIDQLEKKLAGRSRFIELRTLLARNGWLFEGENISLKGTSSGTYRDLTALGNETGAEIMGLSSEEYEERLRIISDIISHRLALGYLEEMRVSHPSDQARLFELLSGFNIILPLETQPAWTSEGSSVERLRRAVPLAEALAREGYQTQVIYSKEEQPSSYAAGGKKRFYRHAVEAAAQTQEAAMKNGFDTRSEAGTTMEVFRLSKLLAHELVFNILDHGVSGAFGTKVVESDGTRFFELAAWDSGPGIDDVELLRSQAPEGLSIGPGKGFGVFNEVDDLIIIESQGRRWEKKGRTAAFAVTGESTVTEGTRITVRHEADSQAKDNAGVTLDEKTLRSELRSPDDFFKDVKNALSQFPPDFKKYEIGYSVMDAAALASELEGMNIDTLKSVMDLYGKRGFMVNEEFNIDPKTVKITYFIDPELETFSFAALLDLIERGIEAHEDIASIRDDEAAADLFRRHFGFTSDEDVAQVLGLRLIPSWKNIVLKYAEPARAQETKRSGPRAAAAITLTDEERTQMLTGGKFIEMLLNQGGVVSLRVWQGSWIEPFVLAEQDRMTGETLEFEGGRLKLLSISAKSVDLEYTAVDENRSELRADASAPARESIQKPDVSESRTGLNVVSITWQDMPSLLGPHERMMALAAQYAGEEPLSSLIAGIFTAGVGPRTGRFRLFFETAVREQLFGSRSEKEAEDIAAALQSARLDGLGISVSEKAEAKENPVLLHVMLKTLSDADRTMLPARLSDLPRGSVVIAYDDKMAPAGIDIGGFLPAGAAYVRKTYDGVLPLAEVLKGHREAIVGSPRLEGHSVFLFSDFGELLPSGQGIEEELAQLGFAVRLQSAELLKQPRVLKSRLIPAITGEALQYARLDKEVRDVILARNAGNGLFSMAGGAYSLNVDLWLDVRTAQLLGSSA